MMRDISGKLLEIDSIVAFNPPTYKGLKRGRVIAFTPKMVRLQYMNGSKKETTVVYPSDTSIIH